MTLRTWHGELLVLAFIMTGVAWHGGGGVEYIGALAVVVSFAHVQVAERLRENAAAGQAGSLVSCLVWLDRYLLLKEALWFTYFGLKGVWPALAGTLVFFSYPAWRRWWRKRYPLGRESV